MLNENLLNPNWENEKMYKVKLLNMCHVKQKTWLNCVLTFRLVSNNKTFGQKDTIRKRLFVSHSKFWSPLKEKMA